MEKNIFKISCLIYLISTLAMIFMAFNPNVDVAPEISSYIQWWYSQPNTETQAFFSKLGLYVFVTSQIGVVVMFFLQKWGAYLYVPSILIIVFSEWLNAGYAPRSSLDVNIDTIASISTGFILCCLFFAKKLEIFEDNKSFKPTLEGGAA